MGHVRLGSLPDTAPWRRVVACLAEGESAAVVAAATTEAASDGLDQATGDVGLAQTVFLLTRVVLAAREPDFPSALAAAGLTVGNPAGLFDVPVALVDAVDQRLGMEDRTDIGEMAQFAAAEALTQLLADRCRSAFEIDTDDIRRGARDLSTKKGFATLYHEFFARLARRFLGYHLGRELSLHVGGNNRFANTGAHSEFAAELDRHCREAAGIVRSYAGDWYSKQHFLGGIDLPKARRFTDHCLKKLRAELLARGGRDG